MFDRMLATIRVTVLFPSFPKEQLSLWVSGTHVIVFTAVAFAISWNLQNNYWTHTLVLERTRLSMKPWQIAFMFLL